MKEIQGKKQLISEKKNTVATVAAKISQVESESSDVHALERDMPAMQEKLISLRGDVAMGQAKQADIETLEAKILDANKRITEHHQLVDGLNKKLQHESATLEGAEYELKELIEVEVRREAEKLGLEYMEIAHDLVSKFRQIMGVLKVHDAVKGNTDPIGTGQEFQFLKIPVFRLNSIGQHPNATKRWPESNLTNDINHQYGHLYAHGDYEAEKVRLTKAGLPL